MSSKTHPGSTKAFVKRSSRRTASVVEQLEARRLLSISASDLFDETEGALDVFTLTAGGVQISTQTRTIVGPATFNGNSAIASESIIRNSSSAHTLIETDYLALTSDGWVSYGSMTVTQDTLANVLSTTTVTDSPGQVQFPATIVAGTSYTSTVTRSSTTLVTGQSTPLTSTETSALTIKLTSETFQSITVPVRIAPYNAYLFDVTEVLTQPDNSKTTTTSQEWVVPGLGPIKIVTDNGEDDMTSHVAGNGGGAGSGGSGEGGAGGSSSLAASITGSLPASVIAGEKTLINQIVTLRDTTNTAYNAPASTQLYLATGNTIDDGSILLPAKSTKTIKLKTGAHQAIRFSLKSIPASVPDGIYHIIAQVTDSAGNISQAASAGTIAVAPSQIDLSVVVGKFATTAKAGRKFIGTLTLTNAGNAAAVGSLPIEVETSPNNNPADGMPLINIPKKINLKPGKSLSIPLSLLIPNAGTFFLIFDIDPGNTFSDFNLANNAVVSSTPITIS